MSLSEITGIPRPTVVRKIKFLIQNNYLHMNEKKLLSFNMKGETLKHMTKLQDLNMKNLSNFLYRVFKLRNHNFQYKMIFLVHKILGIYL